MWDAIRATPPTTLAATLEAYARARLGETANGMALIGASANGVSTNFLLPQGGITPESVAILISEMLDSYDRVRAALVLAGTTSPTDDQIYAGMIAEYPEERLTQYRSVSPDFSGLER